MRGSKPLLFRLSKKVSVIGVPLDLGAGHRGVDMGPQAVRLAKLVPSLSKLGIDVTDMGDVSVPGHEQIKDYVDGKNAHFLREIAAMCLETAEKCYQTVEEGGVPLVIGGDHSVAAGSISGVSHSLTQRGEKLGVIWVDAHTDMNTPATSPSGNVHGMPLAASLGYGPKELTHLLSEKPKVDAANVVCIGIRDVDDAEKPLVKTSGVTVFTMSDVDKLGIREVTARALDIATRDTGGFQLSYDVDAIDPKDAPGVGTPVPGGLTYREAHYIAEMSHESNEMVAMDVVEVNPVLDERNRTAVLARQLILSAFGKQIL